MILFKLFVRSICKRSCQHWPYRDVLLKDPPGCDEGVGRDDVDAPGVLIMPLELVPVLTPLDYCYFVVISKLVA